MATNPSAASSAASSAAYSAASHLKLVEALSSSADEQTSALFFTMLPLEVRNLIYTEFWRTSGLRQHITSQSDSRSSRGIIHTPCLINPTTPDDRYANYVANKSRDVTSKWQRRLKSDWTIHWLCEETRWDSRGRWSPFLPVLLTCKRL